MGRSHGYDTIFSSILSLSRPLPSSPASEFVASLFASLVATLFLLQCSNADLSLDNPRLYIPPTQPQLRRQYPFGIPAAAASATAALANFSSRM